MNSLRREAELEQPVVTDSAVVKQNLAAAARESSERNCAERRFERVENSEKAYRRESLRAIG